MITKLFAAALHPRQVLAERIAGSAPKVFLPSPVPRHQESMPFFKLDFLIRNDREKRSLEHAKEIRFPAAGGNAALFPGLLRVGG